MRTTAEAGAALQLSEVSRGPAFGDIDNDGDVDILITNNNGPVRLLLNEIGSRHHWLQVQLEGVQSNRYGVGARVGVQRQGKRTLWPRAHTDGGSEIWEGVEADRLVTLQEGSGIPWKP